ncbi:MAG: hypothetical protein HC765_07465 [Brachymonas sp.]|nr:hypothetical protein [Brachymonas sp.]
MNRQQQIDHFLLCAHELAAERLKQEPARIAQAVQLLAAWRSKVGANRSDGLWDEWQKLLALPVEQLIEAMTARGDHADHLRSVSPMGVLITQVERAALLQHSRQPA